MNIESNAEQLEAAKVEAARLYLDDVSKLESKLRFAQAEYRMAVERSSGLTGIDYSRDAVATSPTADAIPNAVERYTELKDQLDALAVVVEDAVAERDDLLDSLESDAGVVLRMRQRGAKVSDIAYALGYVEREVYRRQRAGLVELYDAGLPGEYRINYQKAI